MGFGHGHGHGHGHHTDPQHTVWWSFAVLMATALVQAVVVVFSGSVALLADTVHNFADALTAVPLGIAFWLSRRAASVRFPYGYGRAEDLAGVAVVALMAFSAVFAGYEAVSRLIEPRAVTAVPAVAVAAVVGFLGNEFVAQWRIRAGRRIGSAALVADGLHARTDGYTSLAVLAAALGSWLGWWWVDPVVGLAVAVMIGVVLVDAGKQVFGRLLDAADPVVVASASEVAGETPGVLAVEDVRMRWSGHGQLAELTVVVARETSLVEAHRIAHDVEHRLRHSVHRLQRAHVHAHPAGHG
ncbi:cation diffusion facilitator family transporter [Lentzea sp. NPDC051838]|uniref:cation diffusion facilitator family transporter n=1 Tax=Lentzea sp. NPDC051838 TaxID=3154849 RepID=UPI003444F486